MRRRWKFVTTTVCAIGVTALLPSPAQAASCGSTHCYGVVQYEPNHTLHGISEFIRVSCLKAASTSSNFVTEEMWLGTGSSTGEDWVESGMAYGAPQGNSRYWFWADSRPNGTYNEHDLSISAKLGTKYYSEISKIKAKTWGVYRGGVLIGTSTNNGGTSIYESTGEETTNDSSKAAALMSGLYYETNGDIWEYKWNDGTNTLSENQPPYVKWGTKYATLKAWSHCTYSSSSVDDTDVTADETDDPTDSSDDWADTSQSTDETGATTGATTAVTSDATATSDTTDTAATAAKAVAGATGPAALSNALSTIAHQFAGNAGEQAPSAISYQLTDRQAAAGVLSGGNDQVDSDQQVYVIRMDGAFTGMVAKVPSGHAKPSGSSMSVVVDAATGRVTDWSIQRSAPDASSLGQATSLR